MAVAKVHAGSIISLICEKVKAVVAALTTQASATTESCTVAAEAEGHTDNGNRGQHERLSVDDSEPQFFHWKAPPGKRRRLHPSGGGR